MTKNFPMIFGGLIAYLLLILYAGTVAFIIRGVVDCAGDSGCTTKDFNDGVIHVVTIIGGLVSALVISKLSITTPGENPTLIASLDTAQGQNKLASMLVLGYLAVWLFTGLSALLVGVMFYPDINETLSNIGTTWLGLAVAAGYAYFGLDPR